MVKYILKRLLLSVFILFGVSLILYVLLRFMPLSYVETKFYGSNPNATDNYTVLHQELADCQLIESDEKGLPIYESDENGEVLLDPETGIPVPKEMPILKGYFLWLRSAFQGDFGNSWKYGRPVGDVIFENMGVSFMIAFISLILELLIAIPLGIKSACNQYGKLDYTVTVLTMIGISFPSFFFGSLMIKYFSVQFGWFPSTGISSAWVTGNTPMLTKIADMAWHMVLPIFIMVVLSIGSVMRYTRTNTLEVLNADYIRTARAKGLSEKTVIYKHVFRNTMIPLVTMLAGTLPGLFGGAMITETIFSIPGIGKAAYEALSAGDIPFVMGYNMFIAVLTVAGILLTDILYAVVDPRVKLS